MILPHGLGYRWSRCGAGMNQSLIDIGQCLGFTRAEHGEIKRPKCENAELR